MSSAAPRSGTFQKDAVIAVAILVVLLLLWRLLTHPEQFGSAGTLLKTAMFGSYGVALAGRLDGSGATTVSSQQNTNAAGAPVGAASTGQSNSAFTVVRQPQPAGDPSALEKTLGTEEPVKIIAALPAELVEAPPPANSSPDAAALVRRLDEAGAHSGDIQLSLLWNDYNDLDLHCFDPQGERIWYSHKHSEKTGGTLDVDRNGSEPFVASPIENIYWPAREAPPGIYKLYIVYYAQHHSRGPQAIPYTVRVVVEERTNFLSGNISFTGKRELHWICSIQYDPGNPDPAKHRRFLSNR